MKINIGAACILACLAAPFLVACGGDDDGGGGSSGVNSGVDQTKPVEDITAEESKKLCEAVEAYTAAQLTVDVACGYAGVVAGVVAGQFGADAVESCKTAIDECKNGDTTDTDTDTSECTAEAPPAGCDATVGEVEDCLTATVDASLSIYKELPACDDIEAWIEDNQDLIAEASMGGGEVDFTEIPECKDLPAACLE